MLRKLKEKSEVSNKGICPSICRHWFDIMTSAFGDSFSIPSQLLPGGTPGHRIDHLRNVQNAERSQSFSLKKSANHILFQTLVHEVLQWGNLPI